MLSEINIKHIFNNLEYNCLELFIIAVIIKNSLLNDALILKIVEILLTTGIRHFLHSRNSIGCCFYMSQTFWEVCSNFQKWYLYYHSNFECFKWTENWLWSQFYLDHCWISIRYPTFPEELLVCSDFFRGQFRENDVPDHALSRQSWLACRLCNHGATKVIWRFDMDIGLKAYNR